MGVIGEKQKTMVSLQKSGVGLRGVPGGTEVEFLGAFGNEGGEGGHLIGTTNAIIDVVIKTDSQFLGGLGQGHKRIPGLGTVERARVKAHIPFPYPRPRAQFGRVVMQGNFWVP